MSSDADSHLAALFQRVQLNPGAAEPLHHYGNALLEAGRLDDALFRLQQALRLAPDAPPIHHSLGLVFSRLSRWTDAAAAFKRAIDLKPDYSSAHNNLGTALLELGKAAQAIEAFRACLRFQPGCVEAHNNLGIALAEQNQHDEAIRCFHAALALQPESAESHLGLGASLTELGQSDDGMRHFHEALRLKPDAANVHNDVGIACAALNRLNEALAHFGRALELQPDYPMAHKNRSLAWLVQGDFTRGWPEYEHRLLESKVPQRKFEQPRWDGSPLEGKTILVYHEQGLGDTIQFVRYLPMVKARGGRVVFECQAPLAKLLAGCAGIDQLVPARSPLPPFDVQVPLMSLPLLCGTNLDSIPAPAPYLAADPGLEQLWGQTLSRLKGLKVAIAWQGNPHFKRDRQRSIPLCQFAPLARVPGVRLISVQKGAGSEQIGGAGFTVLDLGADLDKSGAFTDTAAILKNVDLIVTSDTAVAHLAGALGVPTWLALSYAADWRWLLEREDCPWYPTMRLFRQKTPGDWADVFERMAKELASVRSHKRPRLLAREKANNRAGCGYDPPLMALGKALARAGQNEEAHGCFREAVQLHPGSAEAEAALGLCSLNLGRPNEAIAPLQRSLKLRPHPDVHCNLGVAFFRIQRFDDAIANYRQAIRLEPRQVDAHHNLGNALRLAGQLDAALASLNEAKRLRPGMAETHYLFGLTLAQQGKHADAVDAFRQAVQLNAEHAAAHLHLGTALAALDRHSEALAVLRTAARLDPCNGEVPFRIANALRQDGKLEEAVAAYRASLRVEPGAVEARLNLGVTLAGLERFEEAETAYRDGLRCRPGNVALINNLGVALKNQLRFDEALACFAEVLRLEPEHVEAHRNRALTWLLLGDLVQGWPEHEWRLRRPDRAGPRFSQPRWDGSPLEGRTILLYPEQGIGDTLQFVRYAALVKAQGGRVLLLCPPLLVPLLRRYEGVDRLVMPDGPMLPFDVYASLMSLPFLLASTQKSIPADIPYLSTAPELEDRWGQVLDRVQGFKVGIAWQGNPDYIADRGRSIPLKCFAPLAQMPGVQLVSLQKGAGVEQLAGFTKPILSFDRQADESTGAFMDTAAMMRRLDLVITSDTAIAHLAGALGVPVWVALPQSPDWRWQLDREDSPWYPTMRLFRQKRRGDWNEVFGRLAAELQAQLHRTHGPCNKTSRPPSPVQTLQVATSPGELIDKLTILEIKSARITEAAKLANVHVELAALAEARGAHVPPSTELTELTADLKAINEALWDVEDDIRRCEAEQDFDDRFIELARAVYHQNDRRAAVKRRINELLGSAIVEEKSYANYRASGPERKTVPPIATICILTYGDYLDYYRRCLDSILANTPTQEIELRLGFNQAPASLAYALEKLQPGLTPTRRTLPNGVEMIRLVAGDTLAVTLWNSPVNLYKEPMARLMFHSQPLEREYVIWFDDDSFVSEGWWQELRKVFDQRLDYIGQDWWVTYLPGQREMIQQQPWYRGVPFAERDGLPGVRFMTGGFLALRTECLQAANFPDTQYCWKGDTLKQYGGDTLLGEIARQFGWKRAAHSTHIHVNVDLEGKHPAPRRGGTGRQFGSDIEAVVR